MNKLTQTEHRSAFSVSASIPQQLLLEVHKTLTCLQETEAPFDIAYKSIQNLTSQYQVVLRGRT